MAPGFSSGNYAVETKVLATLWTLGTPETFCSVSDRFDMAKSTLHGVFIDTCMAICNVRQQFMTMPNTAAEMSDVSHGSVKKTGFPGVIGAIDGTHISIPGPTEHQSSYINYT